MLFIVERKWYCVHFVTGCFKLGHVCFFDTPKYFSVTWFFVAAQGNLAGRCCSFYLALCSHRFLSLVPVCVPFPFNWVHISGVSNFSYETVSKVLIIPVTCLWHVCLWMRLLGDDAYCGMWSSWLNLTGWLQSLFSFLDIDTESLTFCSFIKKPNQTLGFCGTCGPLKWAGFLFSWSWQLNQASLPPEPEDRTWHLLLFSFILLIVLSQCWPPSHVYNIWKCDCKVVLSFCVYIYFRLFIFIFYFWVQKYFLSIVF